MKPINVLSLFDGCSCGKVALEKANICIGKYYASEIDKHAIAVSNKNHPDIIRLGDVRSVDSKQLPTIDLLMGGSPCQGFSYAGKKLNFNDPRSALFFEFVRVLNEIRESNQNVKFILENVKMKREWQDIISKHLGVDPIEINSSLVSAQNRKRLYWTNISGVGQPTDLEITLGQIINPNYFNTYLSEEQIEKAKNRCAGYTCVTGNKVGKIRFISNLNEKSKCLTAKNIIGSREQTYIHDKFGIRILNAIERERLQNLPDNYTSCVSNNERFKILGNGWNVNTISYILTHLQL